MIITTEGKILDAASDAISDYNRIVVLYQHDVMTTQEFINIGNTISQTFINAINSIKEGDNND